MANRRIVLPIEGMSCGSCATAVQQRLRETSGVANATVNYTTGRATVELNDGSGVVADLVRAIRETGFDCAKASTTIELDNLHYAAGVARLEERIAALPGVLSVAANQASDSVTVDYVPGRVTWRDITNAIAGSGIRIARPLPADESVDGELRRVRHEIRLLWAKIVFAAVGTLATVLGSFPLFGPTSTKNVEPLGKLMSLFDGLLRSLLPPLFAINPSLLKLGLASITVVVLAWSGSGFFITAWRRARNGTADMNTLFAIGVGALFAYSVVAALVPARTGPAPDVYFETVNAIVLFVLLGRALERKARANTESQARRLAALRPERARVVRDGVTKEIAVDDLQVSDTVVVGASEPIPADGIVMSGESEVDEGALTGDDVPVPKRRGDWVLAGSINGRGTFALEVTGLGRHSALSQVLALLREGIVGKAPLQPLADRVAGVLVPIVIAIAVVAFLIWYTAGPSPRIVFAMLTFVTVLLVACPCAIGLAAPMAVKVGLAEAVRHGLLVQGPATIERLHDVDTIVFDKSGTITEGCPNVTHILGAKRADGGTVSPAEILRLAATVESESIHVIGRAIVRAAESRGISIGEVERFVAMSGRGVRGIVGKWLVEVISVSHAEERSLSLGRLTKSAEVHLLAGRTPLVVVVNDAVQGLIVLTDEIRPTAKRAIEALSRMGYELVLLSGDSKTAAGLVGRTVGIDRVLAPVPAGTRVDEIRRLMADGRTVAMVSLNDAEALAAAHVGIALGVGPEVDVRASDVTVIPANLRGVVAAFELAGRTIGTVRANLFFAFVYNLLGIPLAAGALYPVTGLLLSPIVAALAMAFASLSVVGNSLRLRRFTPSIM